MKSPFMKSSLLVQTILVFGVSSILHAENIIVTPSTSSPAVSAHNIAVPKVYFIEPITGQQVEPTFTVKFGLVGMGVAPAGIEKDKTGHHHLLIDVDQLPPMDKPLPADEHVKHFGGGQTEAQITLSPGKHTLQLVLANYLHIPIGPNLVSEKITVNVQ